jgi:two-component system NarL family sensor kinase
MPALRRAGDPSEPRQRSAVRWALLSMIVTAALAFVAVGTAAVFVANGIARKNALDEAKRSARSLAMTIFSPGLPRAMAGDADALEQFRRVVAARSRDGSLVRVKVWNRDGTVVYSDNPSIIGRRFPLDEGVRRAIEGETATANVSELDDPENIAEADQFDRLVEVYTPMILADGTRYAFESYSTDARVLAAERDLTGELVPFALGALLVLLVAQLPLSLWLVRRVSRGQQDRTRLLRNTLIASARERRAIARELHDGVVQDLAGVGYAVGALIGASNANGTGTTATRTTLDKVSAAVRDAIGKLRALMIDIYPPDLTADGLGAAVDRLAEPLRARDVDVDIDVDLPVEPAPDVAETLYRCAREGFGNIAAHSAAQHVKLTLEGNAHMVRLLVRDDGRGMAAPNADRRREGHFGLSLLREAALDLGGELQVESVPGSGTTLSMRLPTSGMRCG